MAQQRDVELVHYCAKLEECPKSLWPEVALSGRSNVGKSSLVNLLMRRKSLAHISKQPGKTRCLIYFAIDNRWHLVDMPGYGYARVPVTERQKWATNAKRYFHGREQLTAVVQLIDIRVGPTPDDKARLREISGMGKPLCLTFTKADKIARTKVEATVAEQLRKLDFPLPPETGVVITSATKGYGHAELWAWIEDQVDTARRRLD